MEKQSNQQNQTNYKEKDIAVLNTLINFIKSNKGDCSPIEINFIDENNRFLISSKDLEKGEMINIIPHDVLLTCKIPAIKKYSDLICQIPFFKDWYEQQSICAWMSVNMNREDSFWKPYFDILPKDFSCFPFYFTQEELDLLGGTSFINEVNNKRKQLLEECDLISKIGLDFDPENYIKARHLCYSRNFWIKVNGSSYSAVVPLGDSFNYKPDEVNVKWKFEDDKFALVTVAKNKIKKGQEVVLDYGYHRNNHFLLYSGFTLKNNKGIEEEIIYPNIENHPDFGLFGVNLVRALIKYRKNRNKRCNNLEDELSALKLAKDKINQIITGFKSSYNEDMKKYNKKGLSWNMTNILRVIIEEKKLMNAYLKIVCFFSDILENFEKDKNYKISEKVLRSIESDEIYNEYFIMLDGQLKLNPKTEEVITFSRDDLFSNDI